jgi:hypothetical protein
MVGVHSGSTVDYGDGRLAMAIANVGDGGAATVREATAEFSRPSNITGYDAGDVISNSTSASVALSLDGLVGAAGGGGRIVAAVLKTDKKDFSARVRVHLFTAAPTAISNDNVEHRILWADRETEIDYIDFPAFENGTDTTNSTAAISVRNDLYRAFVTAEGATGLKAVLEILDPATPASAQSFHLMLRAEG